MKKYKNYLIKNLDFILKKNTIISLIFIILITLIITHYYNRYIGFISCIILLPLFLYLYNTPNKNKNKMLFVFLVFSICTFIGENIIIYKTQRKALFYNYVISGFNVPSWLFLAYLNMLIFIWLLEDYFNTIL